MAKNENSGCRQGQKKARIGSAGGNIGGLVVWGGALAVATVMAAFTLKRSRRRHANKDGDCCQKEEQEKETKLGTRSVRQTPPYTFPSCTGDGSTNMLEDQIDSCDVIPTKSLILERIASNNDGTVQEQSPTPVINGGNENSISNHLEIRLTDDSRVTPCYDFTVREENPMPIIHGNDFVFREEKNPLPMINSRIGDDSIGDCQEILLSDDPRKESFVSSDDCVALVNSKQESLSLCINCDGNVIEEFSCAVPLNEVESRMMEDSEEELSMLEREEDWKEEETVDAEKITPEKVLSMHSVEEEEEEDDINDDEEEEESNEEYIIEKGEENSEGRGSSSTESNTDLIWPVEAIEALSLELKKAMKEGQNTAEEIVEKKRTTKTEDYAPLNSSRNNDLNSGRDNCETTENSMFLKEEVTLALEGVNHTLDQPIKLRKLVWPVSVLVLLLLLLFAHHDVLSFYRLDSDPKLVPMRFGKHEVPK